jgi:hypothetical protein
MSGRRAKKQNDTRSQKPGQQLVLDPAVARQRRMRFPENFPVPPEDVAVPYAKRHIDDFDAGELVAWLVGRPEWDETIGAECDLVETERPSKGPRPSYDTRELEKALFFQVVAGIRTYRAARDRLAGDRGSRARAALGFDQPREPRCPQELKLYAGVPSEATMSRHRKRFPHERRVAVYKRYFHRLRVENVKDPVLAEGLRILGIDGSAQLTSLTCPKLHSDGSGVIVNASRVTCPEGGYVGKDAPSEKQGMGFGVVPLTSIHGLPWAYEHGRINLKEGDACVSALDDFIANVLPHVGELGLGVLAADSGFSRQDIRGRLRSIGYLDCIHEVSHAQNRESTDRDREAAARRRFDIEDYPNWYADGFRELHCRCGKGHTFRRVQKTNGRAVARVEGTCASCGTITVTSGRWKAVRDTTRPNGHPHGQQRFARVHTTDPESVIDWTMGNPLSFNDPLAAKYGSMRFGHGEGFNGTAVERFKLLKTKGYYCTKAQAELHCLMVFCVMHGETMRQRALTAESAHEPAAQLLAAA